MGLTGDNARVDGSVTTGLTFGVVLKLPLLRGLGPEATAARIVFFDNADPLTLLLLTLLPLLLLLLLADPLLLPLLPMYHERPHESEVDGEEYEGSAKAMSEKDKSFVPCLLGTKTASRNLFPRMSYNEPISVVLDNITIGPNL